MPKPVGRQKSWMLDPSTPLPVFQDIGEVGRRGRVTLPTRGPPLPWLIVGAQVLALLDEPGRIRLLEWNAHWPEIEKKRDELLARGDDDEEAVDDLQVLADLCRQVHVEAPLRITLQAPLLAHLNVRIREPPDRVHLVRFKNRVEIWSVAYRNKRLRERPLEGLP